MKVLGIDIATHTGMVLLDGDEHRAKSIDIKTQKGYGRLQSIAKEVGRTLDLWQPELIMIEGYAKTPVMGIDSFVTVVECSTLVRMALYERGLGWMEVPPTVLKKWTTGKGNADKESMSTYVGNRWGFKNENSDIIDAYALARMGQAGVHELRKLEGVQLVVAGSKVAAVA
jgi:Holliday junction resolvasome RuvABC endonuclease subunit